MSGAQLTHWQGVILRHVLGTLGPWMIEGEAVRKIARAGKILERMPEVTDTEPKPPMPVGGDASTEQVAQAVEDARAYQTAHQEWERSVITPSVHLSPKDQALIKEVLAHKKLLEDERLRNLVAGDRMAAFGGLLRDFDVTPDEND